MGARIKNYIFYFTNYLLIFYTSKIKFKKSTLKEKMLKEIKEII